MGPGPVREGAVSPSGASLLHGTGFCGSGCGGPEGQTFDPVPCRMKNQNCHQPAGEVFAGGRHGAPPLHPCATTRP